MQHSALPNEVQKAYQQLIDDGLELYINKNGTPIIRPKEKFKKKHHRLVQQYRAGLLALLKGQPVNVFAESLEKEKDKVARKFLDAVYEKAFYNFDNLLVTRSGPTVAQKKGCDVMIYLTNDRVYRIDEKKRFIDPKRYPKEKDIALEFLSSDRIKSPGWMEKDLGIDYLCYAFVHHRRAYLFPWQQLKMAWEANKRQWIDWAEKRQKGFSIITSPNPTYNTISCGVPPKLLIQKVKESLVINIPDLESEPNHV